MSRLLQGARSAVPEPIWAAGVDVRDRARFRLIQLMAQRHLPGLVVDVSPNDDMINFRDPGHYFRVGTSALAAIERALSITGADTPRDVLDLPCGYGRVLRHLRARWPTARFAASDLNREGVDFCASHLGADPVYSTVPVSSAPIDRSFDLIWCGSLLTHFDASRWHDTLRFFSDHLAPGGTLVFTTHGIVTERVLSGDARMRAKHPGINNYGLEDEEVELLLSGYRRDQFGFARYPGGDHEYGISLASDDWVVDAATASRLVVADHFRQGWDSHQDVWTCIRR